MVNLFLYTKYSKKIYTMQLYYTTHTLTLLFLDLKTLWQLCHIPYILDAFNKCQGIVFFELDGEFILFKFILTIHFAKNNISRSAMEEWRRFSLRSR